MIRELGKLSARKVETLRKPGRHSDGGNLYLNVKGSGAKSWLFIYRIGGKQREMGLGSLERVPLAKARTLAREAREALGSGRDPIHEKKRPKTATFGQRADAYVKAHKAAWTNLKHVAQWETSLGLHAASLREKPIDQITPADVVGVLEPLWSVKHETARRTRQRIEAVMKSAKALGQFQGDNPASREVLHTLLPKLTVSEKHHAALPIEEIPDFFMKLRQRPSVSSAALEFTILTAARSGEGLGATWREIDGIVWNVPKERMKGKRPHRVPLCQRSLEILDQMRLLGARYIFPGAGSDTHLSNMAMAELLKDLRPGITVHGFRSTFRDWCSEHTNFPSEVAEMALAHLIGNKTEAAYRRQDLFIKRSLLMETWAKYCNGDAGRILSAIEQIKNARRATA